MVAQLIQGAVPENRFFALLKSDFFSDRDYLSYGAWILIEIWHSSPAAQQLLESKVQLPYSFLGKFRECPTKESFEKNADFVFRLGSFLKQVSHAFTKLLAGLRIGMKLTPASTTWLRTDLRGLEKTLQYQMNNIPEQMIESEWIALQRKLGAFLYLSDEVEFKTDFVCIDTCDNTLLHLLVSTDASMDELDAILNEARYAKLINYRNVDHKTPLIIAAAHAGLPLVHSLVSNRATFNVIDKYNQSPLYLAIVSRNYDVIQYLLDLHAEVDPEDLFGENPLHVAASIGDSDIVLDLLNRGFDMNQLNFQGQTPVQIAQFHQHLDIVRIFEQHAVQ